MAVDYDIVVKGNSLRLNEGYLALATLTLIHTENGPIMFDVGHAVNRECLVNALARHDLKPSNIPKVVLSHLHYDHVNNIDLFPYSTKVYVSRAEWDYVEKPHENDPFVPWLVREQLQKYDLILLEGSGELESGVKFIPAPGHTPGSTAVVLDTEHKGRVVIAGDAVKFPKEALKCASDHAFDSPKAASQTIKHLLSIADRIVPGHFSEMVRQDGTF
ncbi:MAG: MBL fold metallo-hydrolase, partial [Verrucomicrobia bacterium]|nr:MBL fold metallo-hydrolase [Verrucomicrobiota bacterium]